MVTSGHLKKCAEESINTAVDLASVQVQLEDRERQCVRIHFFLLQNQLLKCSSRIIALKDTLQRVQTERDQLKAECALTLVSIETANNIF